MNQGQSLMMAGALAFAPAFWGCSDASGEGNDETLGSVEMHLASTGQSGITYRLRNALFNVVRDSDMTLAAVLNSESDPDATLLTGNFLPGGYTVTLQNGWTLERTDQPGTIVNSQLLSSPSQFASISTGVTRTLSYKFRADDESVVFGGTLAIEIDVCGEDGFEPNDSAAQATNLPFNQVLQGAICGNSDFFSFTQGVFAGLTDFIQLDFTHAFGDLDLRLTLPDGTTRNSFSVTDQERIEFPTDQSGLHVVEVIGFQGAVGNYSLLHGEVEAVPPGM